jgi:hypothetical protein
MAAQLKPLIVQQALNLLANNTMIPLDWSDAVARAIAEAALFS